MLDRWIASIGEAADELSKLTGAARIDLCGVRLGGLLAAAAAARAPGRFGRIALMAPVLDGNGHVRELRLRERMTGGQDASGGVTFAGFSLSQADLRRLAGLRLAALAKAAAPEALLLLHGPADRPDEEPWRLPNGAPAELAAFAGYVPFMRAAHLAEMPVADFDRVTAFLAGGGQTPSGAVALEATVRSAAPPVLENPVFTEQPLLFGPDWGLFGILCQPAGDPALVATPGGAGRPARRQALLILNAAATHRVGDGRYAVLLARLLAAHGFASLRMDLSGIGDSARELAAGGQAEEADIYRRARARLLGRDHGGDIRAALSLLRRRGFGAVTAMGVCSGAAIALAAALREPRLTGLILVNLPGLPRGQGMRPAGRAGQGKRRRAPRGAESAAEMAPRVTERAPDRMKLRTRLARAVLGHAARNRLRKHLWALNDRLAPVIGSVLPASIGAGMGKAAQLRRALRRLHARGVRGVFLFSTGDRGFALLQRCFGQGARRLPARTGMSCHIVEGKDHAFTTLPMRAALLEHALAFMKAGAEEKRLFPEEKKQKTLQPLSRRRTTLHAPLDTLARDSQ